MYNWARVRCPYLGDHSLIRSETYITRSYAVYESLQVDIKSKKKRQLHFTLSFDVISSQYSRIGKSKVERKNIQGICITRLTEE